MSDSRPPAPEPEEGIEREDADLLAAQQGEFDALRSVGRSKRLAWFDSMIRAEAQDTLARAQWHVDHPTPERHGSLRDDRKTKERLKKALEASVRRGGTPPRKTT